MTQCKNMNPEIIFENEYLLAINKPSGLVVHSDGKTEEKTLCDWLLEIHPEMKDVGEPMTLQNGTIIYRPGIVHRLDRDTSGVMVVAKSQNSFLYLKKQFQERETKKIYSAIVWGIIKEDKGKIERPIGRSRSDFRKWSAERHARGEMREAVTEYKVLGRIETEENIPHVIPQNFTYIEASPKTGRTHQIRVHFKAINHPVVNDPLYAENHPHALGFKRLALHSRRIEIEDLAGRKHIFEAPLPDDFVAAISKFGL